MINRNLPLTDLHRHLDGNIRIQTIIDLGQQFNIPLPGYSPEALRPHVQVVEKEPSLVAFLSKLDWGVNVLGDLESCYRVAKENVEDAYNAGIDYAELRFSPYYMAKAYNLPVQGVVEAVVAGVAAGQEEYDIAVNLIGIMSRTFGQNTCQKELNALIQCKNNIVAVDSAGDELGYPGNLFSEHFHMARDAGFRITVHAGEAAGAEAIWYAVHHLGAERIGHGVKAVEDEKLLAYLASENIGIESCITSNIQTNTVKSFVQHPIRTFVDNDICVSLNTDDPAVEGIEIAHEYRIAKDKVGLNDIQIGKIQNNGLSMAFLTEQEKNTLKDKVKQRR